MFRAAVDLREMSLKMSYFPFAKNEEWNNVYGDDFSLRIWFQLFEFFFLLFHLWLGKWGYVQDFIQKDVLDFQHNNGSKSCSQVCTFSDLSSTLHAGWFLSIKRLTHVEMGVAGWILELHPPKFQNQFNSYVSLILKFWWV